MSITPITREVTVGDKTIKFEFNKFAKQANSVMVSCGDTQVLVCVVAAEDAKPDQDFFPLTVDYFERTYAAGRFPGGFVKRETRQSEHEVLTCRVIDRPLRPLFPEHFLTDVQITCTTVSYDPAHHPAPLALMGASVALMISNIPFDGPVAALRIGMKDGQYILDPKEGEGGDLDLNVAAKPGALLMVEAGANFLSEEQMLDAISHAQKLMEPIFAMQLAVQKEIGLPKRAVKAPNWDKDILAKVNAMAMPLVNKAFTIASKTERKQAISSITKDVLTAVNPTGDSATTKMVKKMMEEVQYQSMRGSILETRK